MTTLGAALLVAVLAAPAPDKAALDDTVKRCIALGFTDLSAAASTCTKAIADARQLGDVEQEATAFAFRAAALAWGADWDGSISDAEQALALSAAQPDGLASREASMILGAVHRERGDAGPALIFTAEAIDKCRRAGDAARGSLAHSVMARTLFWLGDFSRARTEADTAIAMAQSVHAPFEEFYATWQRGMTELDSGHLDEAAVFLGGALRLAEAIRFMPGVFQMHVNLAALNIQRGNNEAVRPALAIARRIIDSGGAPPMWRTYLDETEGTLLAAEGDLRTAADRFSRAAKSNPSAWLQTRALVGRARSLRDDGRVDDAIAVYREAIAAVEGVRADTPADTQRAIYMAENLVAYRELVSMLWQRGDAADAAAAFEISEAARARALRDALAAAGRTPELSQPVTVAAVQSRLSPGQLFIEYMQAGTQLFAFAVSPSGVSWQTLPSADPAQLAVRVGFFRRLVQQEATTGPLSPAARRLFDDLIAPLLASGGANVTTLILAPDGVLQFLPFELLAAPPTGAAGHAPLLVEHFVVEYSPSAALLLTPRALPGDRRVLAVSDPHAPFDDLRARSAMRGGDTLRPLVFSRAEADEVFRSNGRRGTILNGDQAKESAVKGAALGDYAILHFATHAVINDALPQRSALLLGRGDGEDGLLEAGEIYGLSLRANLVVLSACQTGVGQLVGGEGPQSLGRAFLRAGAERVVSTLWPIDDQDTVALMAAFYRSLGAGIQPAMALTLAKRAAIARNVPPRVWAAFVLNGRADDPGSPAAPAAAMSSLSMMPLLVALLATALVLGYRGRRG